MLCFFRGGGGSVAAAVLIAVAFFAFPSLGILYTLLLLSDSGARFLRPDTPDFDEGTL